MMLVATILLQSLATYLCLRATDLLLKNANMPGHVLGFSISDLQCFFVISFLTIPLVGMAFNLFSTKYKNLLKPILFGCAGYLLLLIVSTYLRSFLESLDGESIRFLLPRIIPAIGGIAGYNLKLRKVYRNQAQDEQIGLQLKCILSKKKGKSSPKKAGIPKRVALPPSRELGELKDDECVTTTNRMLEVHQLWGDTVLDVKGFDAQVKEIWVGENKTKVHFPLPKEVLPRAAFAVAKRVGNDVVLSFSADTTGEVVSRDAYVRELDALYKSGKAVDDPATGFRNYRLEIGEVATLHFGSVGLRFRQVSQPASYRSTLIDNLDFALLNMLVFSLFAFSALITTFQLRPKSVKAAQEEIYQVPDRFVKLIVTRPQQSKKDYLRLVRLRGDGSGQKKTALPRAKGKQGKVGLRNKRITRRRSAVRAIKPSHKKVVGTRGLLGVLSTAGPKGLSRVIGGSGLGGELEGAIGEMSGSRVGNSKGFGGLGLKGSGSGGGGMGNTIGVGRLGTRGRGGGRARYGTGVARVRRRSERNIRLSVGRPVIVGSLSMEIIRRVIHTHRDQIKYCYSRELTRKPNLRGKVPIRFTINSRGYVRQAAVYRPTIYDNALTRCIVQRVRTWRFPAPRGGGIVIVTYPFILNPD